MNPPTTEPVGPASSSEPEPPHSDISLVRRLLGVSILSFLVIWGVADLGVRIDEVTLGVTECFEDEAACIGQRLELAYLRVSELGPSTMTLRGQGFEMEVLDWAHPPLPSNLSLTRVSVSGVYLGEQRMRGEQGLVHRFRKVKEVVGGLVLLLWALAAVRFVRERLHG